ncbi:MULTISPECIES: TetR/AcrR family transcriptional regulator [Corynebacterium]|jgi:AcrR family transcriptional regulator|uniref:HTH-type transcriptional regulator BetI n=1 Tax=Corynebacterium provencense TaxID=1737425 RepID=A0A2Z3YPM5_9CORY|nr:MULTISPECIES: TetR/AcrR family transcriptional regulator [Corynebacterium]AWT26556.1 HTH-type transcriptional regulator BetI [Corynebacterium provencense]MCI1257129.1 TetR/AcrR family transcriptional regulator [Corynebacterium provencense]
MPKRVDHDLRRHEIIGSVWRLIADEGIDAVTTRRIAEVTGYSNGLLRYYFPGKDSVITEAYRYVVEATDIRAALSTTERGMAGLRTLAEEIMPLDDVRRAEARVALAFWQRALNHGDEADLFSRSFGSWREFLRLRLTEAVEDGEIPPDTDTTAALDELLTILMGTQITAAFDLPEGRTERMLATLEAFFTRLRGL